MDIMNTDPLIHTLRKIFIPGIIEFNDEPKVDIEKSLGRPYAEEMANEEHVITETAKLYARPVNNTFFRLIQQELPNFKEHTTNGSDYLYNGIPIEDKNSFSHDSNSWVGNGFKKTKWHFLKKFRIDRSTGCIIEASAILVDTSKCKGSWSGRQGDKTNRSNLKFLNEDLEHIHIICGSMVPKAKYLKPIGVPVYETN